jgi:hypothetical protein
MKISKRQLKKIIKEEYSRLKHQGLIKEAVVEYDKLPRIRTAGYKAYKMDQASADVRGDITEKALMELPDMLTSVEQFLQWFDKYSGSVVSTDPSDVLVAIAVEDDRLSSRSIDRIEMISRQLQRF